MTAPHPSAPPPSPNPSPSLSPSQSFRLLRIAAHAELVSLVVMLANLATVHLPPVSSLMGPTHGCAYLFVVVATWRQQQAATSTKAVAVIPGIGGLLALRRLERGGSGNRSSTSSEPGQGTRPKANPKPGNRPEPKPDA
ncbi:hypothetical protein [Streptomyces sp. NPDC003077]|uniref:hypothetical protein n=1 Tax=Streptomyces sp. NPDC003077 TaxID=3154443 RepID=UPI0033BCB38C